MNHPRIAGASKRKLETAEGEAFHGCAPRFEVLNDAGKKVPTPELWSQIARSDGSSVNADAATARTTAVPTASWILYRRPNGVFHNNVSAAAGTKSTKMCTRNSNTASRRTSNIAIETREIRTGASLVMASIAAAVPIAYPPPGAVKVSQSKPKKPFSTQ